MDRCDGVQRIRELLARHMPDYPIQNVSAMGEGLDHVAFDVNGELIVRVGREEERDTRVRAVRREAGVLGVAARHSPLPVPRIVFADDEAGAIAYRKLPGEPLSHHDDLPTAPLAGALGAFLDALHGLPTTLVQDLAEPEDGPLTEWLIHSRRDLDAIRSALDVERMRLMERFLGSTPPSEPRRRVLCHNDLGAEHILVDPGSGVITGVIDWGDATIADPAVDLALILRDLGPDALEVALMHYRHPFDQSDRERAMFYARCKLIEDIAYGLGDGDRRYAERALVRFAWVFPGGE